MTVEIKGEPLGKLFVFLHPKCQVGINEINGLFSAAGVDCSEIIFVRSLSEFQLRHAQFVVSSLVLPIDNNVHDSIEIDNAGRLNSQIGGRTIILIGPGFYYPVIHPVAIKYGTQCCWSSSHLSVCIFSDKLPTPVDSECIPKDRPMPTQVKCR